MMRRRSFAPVHVTAWLACCALIAAAGLALWVLQHAVILAAVLVAAVAGAYLAGRRHGGRRAVRPGCQHHVMAQQVAELEQVAGRPIGAVIESYQHIQARYRTGGQR